MNYQTTNLNVEDEILSIKDYRQSCFKKLLFMKIYSLMKTAQNNQLNEEVIQEFDEQTPSEALFWGFYQLQKNGQEYRLIKQLTLFFRSILFKQLEQLILIFMISMLSLLVQLIMPIVIRQILIYVSEEDKNVIDGIILIMFILTLKIIGLLCQTHSKLMMRQVGYDAMSILSMQIMSKCLRISMLSNTQRTIGEITNLIQVDAQKIITVVNNLMNIIIMPIQTVITLAFIYQQIGISVFMGIIIIILTLLINNYLGKHLLQSQKRVLQSKDDRIKQTNEVFQLIKFIKINSYEQIFQTKIEQLREVERKCIDKRLQFYSLNVFFGWLSPQLILSLSFGLYIYLGNQLTPAKVFPIISLLLLLAANLQLFPISINALLEIQLSLKRLSAFLETDEIMNQCITSSKVQDNIYSIQISKGNFYWNKKSLQNQGQKILNNIELKIKQGSFVSIIGDVGSGKSSIIQALLGEMVYNNLEENPKIQINGKISYVGQKAWIQNGTLRQNIIFGKNFNQENYDKAIYYSCLSKDLEVLIDGDLTMIGEKGINLSGGQKARVSLARAIYSGAEIILLDDPLSAVDVHVGNFIMKECFLKHLSTKTRVLSTHALNYSQFTDHIYLIQNGEIIDQGNFGQITKNQKYQEIEQNNQIKSQNNIQQNTSSQFQTKSLSQIRDKTQTEDIILKEDRQLGEIDYEVYQKYFLYNGGFKNYVLLIIIMVIWIISQLISNFWIAKWASDSYTQDHNNYVYLSVYFSLGIIQSLFAYARAASVVKSSLKSATRIHNEIIKSLLNAPQCEFFERIPIGRIMNRLTKDINSLDIDININISLFSTKISQIISSTLLAIITSTKLIIAPFFIFFYLSLKIKNIYMSASRELQRLELITKSPILSYFVESLQGLQYIRAYEKSNQFLTTFSQKLDQNRSIIYVSTVANCWFTQVLGCSSLIVNMTAITYCILFQSNASFIGLIMTYVSNLDTLIQSSIDTLSTLENNIISFERCLEFTKIPQESTTSILKVEPYWPKNGFISFNNLSVKYRPDLPLALRNFSYQINSNQKIGIVGRTGAGKSTITLCLLRILEAQSGEIYIDNIDISKIPLQKLRNSITTIQQDPIIFNGTIRLNLDPFHQFNDDQIIRVLHNCCLTNLINQRNGLDTIINESGDNLSAGEKQLLCIARAVLKKSKIVLIDEATANIDIETEQKIQKVISDSFSNSTVLIIAHRINTIMLCDRILIIDNGVIVEQGQTQDLIQDPSSIFYNISQEVIKNEALIH